MEDNSAPSKFLLMLGGLGIIFLCFEGAARTPVTQKRERKNEGNSIIFIKVPERGARVASRGMGKNERQSRLCISIHTYRLAKR